jgi:hypothetical protein
MKKEHITKFILLFIVVSILLSVFSISVFAETEEGEDVEKEYTFWEDLQMVGFLIFAAIVSPILTLANWFHELFGFAPLI